MQTINIDISDSGRIIIEDRVYYPENNGIEGMLQNSTTNEKALLKLYTDQKTIDTIEAFEYDVLAVEGNKRGFKNIIYPRIIKQNAVLDEEAKYYAFTEIPNFSGTNVHKLSSALAASGFSIYSRIMAATNLAETLNIIHNYIGKNILSIHPEDIFVNTDNGDVYIWIEQWLSEIVDLSTVNDFGFSPEWYSRDNKNVTESDFRFFLAYAIFRLLCNDEPFDGSETLLQFPLLTDEAIRLMRANKFGFALAKGRNYISEYIGQGLWKKWRALPTFLRNEIEKSFTTGIEIFDERTEIPQWLKVMRKLRDCLVYVNGQFRFCDPDVSNKVLFMVIDDYKIPVWPKKAIYWYHVDISINESRNGIIAGVTSKDGRYYLNNLSGNVWGATLNNTSFWIHPEREIEIVEGMTIQLENGKIIKIVNGLVDDPKRTVNVTVQDTLNDPVCGFITDSRDMDDQQDAIQEADTDISNPEGKVD